ncbi:uncharacterized protein LOC128284344 [Gossypium arboreum]|uniref:uncharacterized protein LOC128284344 n=1 Tax=Gossypium arboreum TaxID=29729 RepID=UPI0022F18200|nr:uncharacterized protein LOC128284344 [Gossypium arboreum]
MVVEALSRRVQSDLRAMLTHLSLLDDGSLLAELQVKPVWVEQIRSKQLIDETLGARFRQWREAHNGFYAMHPGENKMYRNLCELYWWPRLKREVMEFVCKCSVCQKVKAKHQLPLGLLQPVKIPLWKDPSFTSQFWKKLHEALGTRLNFKLGEQRVLGPELAADTEDKVKLIRDRLKEALDRQKSYADLKRREIEYAVGDLVFLRSLCGRRY